MGTIDVTFNHPKVQDEGSALARLTIVGTNVAGIIILPGATQNINIAPGIYAIFVAVTTLEGTDWSIDVVASGDTQTKTETGPHTVLFAQVRVK